MKIITTFLILLFGVCLSAQAPEDIITKDLVEGQLRFIASDELQGRRTGEPGNDIAARYIAEQLRSYGVQAFEGHEDYMQTIPFDKSTPPSAGTVTWGEQVMRHGEDMIVMTGEAMDLGAKVVFAGYGLEDAEKGW
ncbi:MAG: peptidase M28, partial [Saprospiraceae bacterium]|nr:peptidase M28 [Saprospiraceae bacterium]